MRAPWLLSSLWSDEPLVAAAAFLALRSKKFDMAAARNGMCLKKLIVDPNNGCLKLSRWSYLPAPVTLRVRGPLGDAPLRVGCRNGRTLVPDPAAVFSFGCLLCCLLGETWLQKGAALGRMVLH